MDRRAKIFKSTTSYYSLWLIILAVIELEGFRIFTIKYYGGYFTTLTIHWNSNYKESNYNDNFKLWLIKETDNQHKLLSCAWFYSFMMIQEVEITTAAYKSKRWSVEDTRRKWQNEDIKIPKEVALILKTFKV